MEEGLHHVVPLFHSKRGGPTFLNFFRIKGAPFETLVLSKTGELNGRALPLALYSPSRPPTCSNGPPPLSFAFSPVLPLLRPRLYLEQRGRTVLVHPQYGLVHPEYGKPWDGLVAFGVKTFSKTIRGACKKCINFYGGVLLSTSFFPPKNDSRGFWFFDRDFKICCTG